MNTLPIECDWSRLDNELFSKYTAQLTEEEKENLSEYANKIWIWHRGVGIDRAEDKFALQKVDLLIVKGLNFVWNLVIQPVLNKVNTQNNNSATSPTSPLRY